jgi:hypothetical protein
MAVCDDMFVGLDLGQMNDPSALVIAERYLPAGTHVAVLPDLDVDQLHGRTLRYSIRESIDGTDIVENRTVRAKLKHHYAVRHLERFKLGTPYPDIVEKVVDMFQRKPLKGATLAIDMTGVGRPVVDMFVKARSQGIPFSPEHVQKQAQALKRLSGRDPDASWWARWLGAMKKLDARIRPITIVGGHAVTKDGAGWRVPKRELASVGQVLLGSKRLKTVKALPEAATLMKELQNFKVKINRETKTEQFSAWRDNEHDDIVLALLMALYVAECASRDLWLR